MATNTELRHQVGGYDAITAVGTALATGAALTGFVNNVTTAGGATAVVLPNHSSGFGGPIIVHNLTATTCLVFPPNTSCGINEGADAASFSVAANKTAEFWQCSATEYFAMLSA